MKEIFNADFFAGNRARLKQRIGDDNPIVLTAHSQLQRSGDVAFPFRQDSNFWYLTGIQTAEVVLVMAEEDFLILPERDTILDTFEGAIDTDLLQDTSGIKQIYSYHEGWEKLIALVKKSKKARALLYKSYDEHHKIFLNPAKSQLVRRLKKLGVELIDIRKDLVHLRMVKQTPELTAIRQAIDSTIDSFLEVFDGKWIQYYPNERDVQAAIEYEFSKRGCEPAYPSIIAGGERACTLHYVANNQNIDSNELLLIDAGAEWSLYASDITRVYAPDEMTPAQASVYQAVKEAQTYVIDQLKPGVNLKEIQKKVSKHIGRYLKLQRLTSSLKPDQVHKYFPHAVSHHLGLDVHDVADYSVPLQEGMVITVEPGIYIPEQKIGIRIEDDILITKNGAEVLSRRLPS